MFTPRVANAAALPFNVPLNGLPLARAAACLDSNSVNESPALVEFLEKIPNALVAISVSIPVMVKA
jgi:hypothetical protein